MNEIALSETKMPEIHNLTNEQLRAELATQLTLTAQSLARAAVIWTELQRRGVDLTALKSGLAFYLPRIARGELAAEAVVAFSGQRALLQNMVGMPLDEQRRYAAGEPVKIASRNEDGVVIVEEKPLADLTARESLLAISGGQVRPIAKQQATLIQAEKRPMRRKASTGSTAVIKADNGHLRIGRSLFDPLDLSRALKALGYELRRVQD